MNIQVIGIRNGLAQQRYHFNEDSGFMDINGGALCGLNDEEEKEKAALLLETKRNNKARLQEKLGLREESSIPLICMVSRLTAVKTVRYAPSGVL